MSKIKSVQSTRSKAPLWGLFYLAIAVVLVNAAITHYLAFFFHYQAALGKPIFSHVYNPFAWLYWQWKFYNQARMTFNWAYLASILAYGAAFLSYSLILGLNTRRAFKHEGLHGTAHWAEEHEIHKTGLLPEPGKKGEGVYVGAWIDDKNQTRYLRHNGPEHIAAIAPTRSGKGVGLVIPTLLSWQHSVVINDMKGELWALTAGWRQKEANNIVLKFDPAAEHGSCKFNPLAEVRLQSKFEVADVQNLVTIIVDPDGKGLNDHWAKTAHSFLTGVTLHLLYLNSNQGKAPATLKEVAMALSDPSREIDQLYNEMIKTIHRLDLNETHEVVASSARDMLNRPAQERGSVLSSAMSYLALYRDPLVALNTESSDFRIHDLMKHEKAVSLYLVVRPADKDRLKPLMRLILNQIVRTLTRDEMKFVNGQPKNNYNHRLLLMLDEFPSFGKLEVFQEALAFIAGYGIKSYLIMQDISQLKAAYTQNESILSNCHIRVAYAPNKPETAEWLSKITGTATVVVEDISTSGKRFGAVLDHVNQSFHSVSRPLMTPDECMRLPGPTHNGKAVIPGDMLIFSAGHAPIYGSQILYFQDPTFKRRATTPMPSDTDRIKPVKKTEKAASRNIYASEIKA
jgi:type IV secretion system protein VirD4